MCINVDNEHIQLKLYMTCIFLRNCSTEYSLLLLNYSHVNYFVEFKKN